MKLGLRRPAHRRLAVALRASAAMIAALLLATFAYTWAAHQRHVCQQRTACRMHAWPHTHTKVNGGACRANKHPTNTRRPLSKTAAQESEAPASGEARTTSGLSVVVVETAPCNCSGPAALDASQEAAAAEAELQPAAVPLPGLDSLPHIFLTTSNAAYFEMALNWARSVEAIESPYLIAGALQPVCR